MSLLSERFAAPHDDTNFARFVGGISSKNAGNRVADVPQVMDRDAAPIENERRRLRCCCCCIVCCQTDVVCHFVRATATCQSSSRGVERWWLEMVSDVIASGLTMAL